MPWKGLFRVIHRASFPRVTGRIPRGDMTYFYVWHDSFLFVTSLNVMCDMIHSHVWHDASQDVPWRILMCDMTDSSMWHDSCPRVTRLIPKKHDRYVTIEGLVMFLSLVWFDFCQETRLIHMCVLTCQCDSVMTCHDTHIGVAYRSLLQKSPIKETIIWKRDL